MAEGGHDSIESIHRLMASLILAWLSGSMGLPLDSLHSVAADKADSHEIASTIVPVSEVAHEGLAWWL